MNADERLDDLLDDWAELAERNRQVDLDAFIRDHATDLDHEASKRFRKRAAALARINQRLDALQDTHSVPSDTSEPGSAPSLLPELKPGYEPLEGYKLVERLGRGGFGEVWKATDAQGFSVAIKFVPLSGKFGDKELQSLEVMKDVRHPHLLSIVRVAPRDDVLVIAMELADRSLADRFDESRKEGYDGIPREELLEYMAEAAKGIDYLNDPGSSGRPRIQHRDIKPANLLLSGNSVKIADYSLAQALTFNVVESIGSTPAYAAPEFFYGSTTSRSDQYSLAITYCHLRGGRVPFEGSVVELMEAHRNRQPDLDMLPPEERPVVAMALAKKSKDRWPSCAAFVEALKKTASPLPMESSGGFAGLLHKLNELPTKTKAIAGATAAGLIVLALLFMFSGGNGGGTPTESESAQESGIATDDAKHPLTVAVLDFANHNQDPALDGYRLGFRDMLTTDLSKLSSIKVLERARLESLLKEHNLAKTDFIDPETAVQLRRGLSAHAMLSGSYLISGDDIRVDVRLVSVETGEVLQAEAVEGKKADMFGLQKALATKVLAGLDVTPTAAEQEALNQPQTREFEAFRLYSEARLAQLRGNQQEAEARLREALTKDQDFELASLELDRMESDAMIRISQTEQRRARSAGEIGQTLMEHQQKHQRIVEAEKRDPEYFASLLVLSAHAGLWGEPEKERKLLRTFWRRFEESVPPSECLNFSQALKKLVAKEGKFFQTHVDSGYYGILVGAAEERYLKSDLRGTLKWPRWSTMWPFDDGLRTDFDTAERAKSGKFPVKIEPDWFDNQLPLYPHDYLERVIMDIYEARREDASRYQDALETLASVVGYYGRIDKKPASFDTDVDVAFLHSALLGQLKDLQQEQMRSHFLRNLIPTLDLLAKTDPGAERRRDANALLVRFVRQVRINEGGEVSESATQGPLEFCDLELQGSPVVVVWHVASIGGFDPAQIRIEKYIRESLSDVVRGMPADTQFNFEWAGHVNKDLSLFENPQSATNEAKKKGLDWLSQRAPGGIDESLPIGEVIERLTNDLDQKATVIVVSLDEDLRIQQSTIDFVQRAQSTPRICVVATKKDRSLSQLAAAANGAAVTLKAEGGISGWDNVVIETWDLSAEKAKPKPDKTSSIEPIEPRTLSVADFQLQERVEDSEIRQYLESQVKTHLARFDPSLTSTPRYFSSVALLAQIAGRVGHRPLEDALTRKWWAEIRPFTAPDASVAYEQARKKSRRRDNIAEPEPLLSELKTLIRRESNELWFNSKVSGVSSLPKPERAPNGEPYVWASPYFWLRGICQYREEMGSPISEEILRYHVDAGSDFNSLFVTSATLSWMDGILHYYGGEGSGRPTTALRLADLALEVCESIPVTDEKQQKWIVDGIERLRESKAKIAEEHGADSRDWVAPEEYAPRRPWNGNGQTADAFPLFGRAIEARAGLVVVMDISVSDARERSQAFNGLRMAVRESGQDVEVRVVVVGREIVAWPDGEGTKSLDDKGRNALLDWIDQLDQEGPHTSSSTRENLGSAIKEAHSVRVAAGAPPTSIVVVCQESDLEDFQPALLAREIPIHTFVVPRLGTSGGSRQKAQIEKMRELAAKSSGRFTVVSDDWIWLYL